MTIPNTEDLLYRLPYTISAEDQQTLIDYAYTNADWDRRAPSLFKVVETDPFCFGRVQMRRPTVESLTLIPNHNTMTEHQIAFRYRLHPEVEWEWVDNPMTPVVQKLVAPIEHLYQKITRIILLVQATNAGIAAHTDTFTNPYASRDILALQQTANHNMVLKWPLTETPGDNGRPYLYINEKPYEYDVQNNLFVINEIDIMHGAFQSGVRRGVIFLDGILNYENLLKETRLPATVFDS